MDMVIALLPALFFGATGIITTLSEARPYRARSA